MSNETNINNVHIDGDRSIFLTKGSIDRFKNDLKSQMTKDPSNYFKEGWTYQESFEENGTIRIKLVKIENNQKKPTVSKNKILLQVRLSDLANQRKTESQLKHQLQKSNQNVNNDTNDLIDAYLKAKKITKNPVIKPTLVQDNPDSYWEHVNGTVQGCENASNAFATYYRMLQNYIMTEKAKQHAMSS